MFNDNFFTLIDFVKMNQICKIKQYINQEKNLNIVDEFEMTALMWSIIHNNFDVFNILLNANVDLAIKDSSGYTAEDWARYYSRDVILDIFNNRKIIKHKKGKKND
jgi:ankyrin repeat protein